MASAGSAPSPSRIPRVRAAVWVPLLTLGIAGAALVLSAAAHNVIGASPEPSQPAATPSATVAASPEPSDVAEPAGPVSFTLVAAGDVLPHGAVVDSAHRSGSPNWEALWSEVTPWIQGADLALCHMEVPVAPPGTSASGFPIFAAPADLVPALDAQGWDGCSTASNHSVDKGWDGVVATLDAFDAVRLGAAGTARSAEEGASAQYYVVRDGNRRITVAHLSYSYGTNGLPVPSGKPWSVNVYNYGASDVQPILDAAQAARDAGADVILLSVHSGTEYQTSPTTAQREAARKIAESGLVDLYIGHHAHVPQPIELLAGGPNGTGMWTAFGLGNYISNQDVSTVGVAETVNGVLLTATISVALDDTVTVGVEWTSITVDRLGRHTLHLLSAIPNGAGNLNASAVAARYQDVRDAVGAAAPERTTLPEQLADATYPLRRGPWTPGS